jgi:hypothetical protein
MFGSGSPGLVGMSISEGLLGVGQGAIGKRANREGADPSATKPKMSEERLKCDAEREELRTNDGEMGFPIMVCGRSLVILVPLPHEKLSDSSRIRRAVRARPAGESSA